MLEGGGCGVGRVWWRVKGMEGWGVMERGGVMEVGGGKEEWRGETGRESGGEGREGEGEVEGRGREGE